RRRSYLTRTPLRAPQVSNNLSLMHQKPETRIGEARELVRVTSPRAHPDNRIQYGSNIRQARTTRCLLQTSLSSSNLLKPRSFRARRKMPRSKAKQKCLKYE